MVSPFTAPGFVRSIALSTLAVLASARPASTAQGVKLNEPLARTLHGDIANVLCSPDGERVVFRATLNSGLWPLFSAPTKGGTPVVLVEDFPNRFEISPDSRLVHYLDQGLHVVPIDGARAPQRIAEGVGSFAYVPGRDELLFSRATGIFALPLEGGTPVQVTVPPAGTTGFGELSISADGRWVVFHASAGLYSAAVDGSTGPLRLNGDLVNADAYRRVITPDSLRVVYRGSENQMQGLYSAPLDGSAAPVVLNVPRAGRTLTEFALSRDGSRVLYLSDQDSRNVFELYSAPVAGGEPAIKRSAPLLANRDVSSFQAADGGRVVYLADHAADGITELFVVGVAGPASPVRLSHALPTGASVFHFSMTADGRRAVYALFGTALQELFSVSVQRPGVVERLTELVSGESTSFFAISPDSARVAYLLRGPALSQLYSVPIGGGARTRLDDGGSVGSLQFTPDSRRMLYRSDRDAPGVAELFSVESDGGPAPVKLNRPLDEGIVLNDVSSFQFGALGTRGTFLVSLWEEDEEELYGVQLEPRTPPALLATTPSFESVLISPDEEWVAYTVYGGGDGRPRFFLFGVPLDGSRAPEQLIELSRVRGVRFGPDGRTLFYYQEDEISGVYRVPVDSSAPSQELTGWVDQAGPFELSADGSTLVVLADALVDGEHELFSLPSDGSSPPVRLNDLTSPHGPYPYLFQISPDGQRVFYATDEITAQTMELFSVPIDGSTAPARISGALPAGTVVERFVLAPETGRLVYLRSDPSVQQELWSVPMDGSAAPVRLHPALPAGGSVSTPFVVVPGGTQVVFHADLAADEVFELFVAPLDGSAAPRRLNGTLAVGGDVSAFELDGTGTRAVYRADQAQDEVFELFGAALVAPAAPLQLTGPHVSHGDVVAFRTVPGGRHVVFTADHDTDDVFELYAAPVDRVKEAHKLSGPLVDGGDVQPSIFVEPSGRVVYLADQDDNSVFEVYLSSLTFRRAQAPIAAPRTSR